MATRHNLCINPSLTNDNTGWGGGSTPTRITGVSGFGRTTAAHYTSGSFALSARTNLAAVTAGLTYTASVYIRTNQFAQSGRTIYLEWLNSGGGTISDSPNTFALAFATVTQISVTATAPANTSMALIVVDGINFAVSDTDITMALIEQAAALDTFFDGDSPGATWDGTAGNSASTLTSGTFAPPPQSAYHRQLPLLVR